MICDNNSMHNCRKINCVWNKKSGVGCTLDFIEVYGTPKYPVKPEDRCFNK